MGGASVGSTEAGSSSSVRGRNGSSLKRSIRRIGGSCGDGMGGSSSSSVRVPATGASTPQFRNPMLTPKAVAGLLGDVTKIFTDAIVPRDALSPNHARKRVINIEVFATQLLLLTTPMLARKRGARTLPHNCAVRIQVEKQE